MLHAETSGDKTLDAEELFAFPLSPEQRRMWEADREQPGNPAYNAAYRWDLRGRLDRSVLERTFNEIVCRHDILRTKFGMLESTPRQIVTVAPHLAISTTDISDLPAVERDEAMDRLCAEEATRGFDLEAGSLIRVGLLRMAEEHHVLMLTLHHIICDGWSIRLIMEEMQRIYGAFAAGRDSPLREPALQYGDYVVWQEGRIRRGELAPQLDYWRKQLAGYRRLEIPHDLSPAVKFTTKSAITALQLQPDVSDSLKRFSNEQGGTMFSTSLAALMLLLHGYSAENDIAVGSPVAARNNTEVEGLIGLIVNHVVFRVGGSDDGRFPEFARLVRDTVWQAMANQDIPFAHVLAALKDSGEPCPHPFYTINFVCHRAFGGTANFVFEFSGIRVTTIPSKSQGALYDLNFFLIERETGWRLSLEYKTELYSEACARRMLEDLKGLLQTIAADPDRTISEMLISVDERFAKGVQSTNATPKLTAVKAAADDESTDIEEATHDESSTSYELPVGVTQERFWLLAKISPNQSVFNMPASVRIAGPLSTELLERSLQFVVDRHESLRTTFKEVTGQLIQHIAANLKSSLQVTDLGPVQHDHIDTRLQDLLSEEARRSFDLQRGPLFRARLFRIREDDHVLILTLHHIVSDGWSQSILQRDLWSAYAAFEEGRRPSLTPLAIQYADFTSWQNEWLNTEPAREHLEFWRNQLAGSLPILDITANDSIREPSMGEGAIETLQLSDDLISKLKSLGRSENATTFMLMLAGFAILLARYSSGDEVVVGSPSANRRPETEPLIGPFSAPIALRLHLSGNPTLREVVKRTTTVVIDTMDHVELPFEVIFKHLRIRSSHGRNPLFQFYFVYQTAFLRPQQLRHLSVNPVPAVSVGTPFELQLAVIERPEGVRANLDYDPHRYDVKLVKSMLQDYDYVLNELVSNPDQPVANLALPPDKQTELIQQDPEIRAEYVAARDPLERKLAAIWEELFEVPRIGIKDDFFELGGQSIMAAKMITQIEKEFGKRVDLSMLLIDRTIEQLAQRLKLSEGENWHSNLVNLRAGDSRKPPLFCIHGGGGHLLDYRDMVAALPEDQPVFGLRASEIDDVYPTVEQLAEKYRKQIQNNQKRGPYQLCGLSFGGLVAYEIARQLAEMGERVGLIALLDTGNWAHYKNLPAQEMALFRRTYLVDRLKKYGRNLIHGRLDEFAEDIRQFVVSRFNSLLWKVSQRACKALNRPVPKFARSNLVIFSATGREYTPKRYPGKVQLFRAEGRTAEYGDDATLGWDGIAQDGVVVHPVPGGHLTIMRKPQVFRLVEQLKYYLADA